MNDDTASEHDDPAEWRRNWHFPEGVTFLNHGSFGPTPGPIRLAQQAWQDRLARQPMDFLVRELEALLWTARGRIASFVGANADDLVFVENSTYGMNAIAAGFPLSTGDEVLLNDHEYGAVGRIWQRACAKAGAEVRYATLPWPMTTADAVIQAIEERITPKTKLLVVSHITSPTAVVMPVAEICRMARDRGVAVCIDGPHAVATIDLDLPALDCDYYTASCHKWLCAPIGSGFLYVHPRAQNAVAAPIESWGRLLPAMPERWDEHFTWLGTRDPSAYLSVPAAIDFISAIGLERFRSHGHEIARYAREKLGRQFDLPALTPDDRDWFVTMAAIALPPGPARPLHDALRARSGVEIPIIEFQGARHARVSCHLYNTKADVDRLSEALETLLKEERKSL